MQLVHVLFPVLFTVVLLFIAIKTNSDKIHGNETSYVIIPIFLIVSIVINAGMLAAIEHGAAEDTEIWSGRITEIEHKEEWEEWHPPTTRKDTVYYTDSNGDRKSKTVEVPVPGYWEHHYATNHIKTSDDGWHSVSQSADGKVKFNDSYPNSQYELGLYYAVGQPTSSLHSYQNKLKFSKSLFKAGDVDEELVKDLPQYPNTTNSDFTVTRLLGDVPDFKKSNDLVNEWNSELNKFVLDPETGKYKSWKEVNVIFVNVGDLPIEYGYALEKKWEGANKNDFVISFSMVNGEIQWCYPFSWTESQILKINIRDLFLDNNKPADFSTLIDDTCKIVARDFSRKEMADYEYIKYQHGAGSYVGSFIICFILTICALFVPREL